jgi:hypothetical protein
MLSHPVTFCIALWNAHKFMVIWRNQRGLLIEGGTSAGGRISSARVYEIAHLV